MKTSVLLTGLFILAVLFSGCPQPPHPTEDCGNGAVDAGENCSNCPADITCAADKACQNGTCVPIVACKGEGETIPVSINPPECCEGLELISPKGASIVAIGGICTALCGNGICDTETESAHNCPKDCKTEPLPNECNTDSECDDADSCTIDVCSGTPKTCAYTQITSCLDGDNCCPSGCTQSTDADCQAGNSCANITCSSDKKCVDSACVLKTCSERGGKVCLTGSVCSVSVVTAADTTECCLGFCPNKSCTDVTCSSDKKCVAGECVLKTCSERNGSLCESNETCSGPTVSTSDAPECCLGSCATIDPCAEVNCSSDKKCVSGECVLKTCAERGGGICGSGETCSGDTVTTSDSSECCLDTCNNLENCSDLGGILCTEPNTYCRYGQAISSYGGYTGTGLCCQETCPPNPVCGNGICERGEDLDVGITTLDKCVQPDGTWKTCGFGRCSSDLEFC